MKSRFLQLVVPFLLVAARVQANDSEAVDEGGVLVLKKSEHVVMESENLSISRHSVHVAYRFRNTGPADMDTLIAFPIGTEIRDTDMPEDSTGLLKRYGFKLVVDGVARSVEVKNQVTPDRQEVVFYWRQLFPAGKPVSIEHEYSPGGGFIFPDGGSDGGSKGWDDIARNYCIDPKSLTALKTKGGSADQIHYILKTGANWAGPIRHFHLTIRKDRPEQLVFLCAEGVRRRDALTFVIDKTNFVPRSDLKIIFLSEKPNQALQTASPSSAITPAAVTESAASSQAEYVASSSRGHADAEVETVLNKSRPDVVWHWIISTDVNCDGHKDEIFLGHDQRKSLYVGAVLGGTSPHKISLVRLREFCQEPLTVQEYSTDDDFKELGGPPDGWQRSKSGFCVRLRGGSGCEDLLVYWNRRKNKLDWWYGL